MNSTSHKILFAVIGVFLLGACLLWVAGSHGGEYVTYKDPKTGAKYFGDAPPPDISTNVQIEVKKHGSVSSVGNNWTAAERSKTEVSAANMPKPVARVEVQPQMPNLPPSDPVYDQLMYNSQRPTRPSNSKYERDFNRATGAWGRYEDKMFDWRSKGYDMGLRTR